MDWFGPDVGISNTKVGSSSFRSSDINELANELLLSLTSLFLPGLALLAVSPSQVQTA